MTQTKARRTKTKEYRIWQAMKARCYAPSNRNMGRYQKIGIQVCDRWRHSFENFLEDMGPIPKGNYSIERIDPEKDYCPENCCWIPMSEQQKNTCRSIWITYKGSTKILKDWAKELKLNYDTLHGRVAEQGMPFEDAIKTKNPIRFVTIDGKSQYMSDWCKEIGVSQTAVYSWKHKHKATAEDTILHYMRRVNDEEAGRLGQHSPAVCREL